MTGVESARPDGSGYLLSELDLQLFGEGTHYDLAKKLGAHAHTVDGVVGTVFAVWAPGVQQVRVVGDWNDWSGDAITSGAPNLMRPIGQSGVWEIFVPCTVAGQRYKYRIRTRDGRELEKADPFARWS